MGIWFTGKDLLGVGWEAQSQAEPLSISFCALICAGGTGEKQRE